MRKEELKYSITQYVHQLINDVLPESGILGKLSNRTAKYWVEQNQWRLDEILSVFTDKDECIDTEKLAEMYEDVLFENGELRLSLKEIAPNGVKDMLPDKIMIFKKDDLHKLLGLNRMRNY
mgnify:FL=1|jgi:hypothetical protein